MCTPNRKREKRYPCGFFMKSRDGKGGLCTRETCGGSEEEKRNGCEGGIGESDSHIQNQPKKLGGLEFSSYISLSVSQECCLCPRERRGRSHHIHTLTTPENEKSFVPIHHMHRELCIMGCLWLSNWFSFFWRILKQLPPQFIYLYFFILKGKNPHPVVWWRYAGRSENALCVMVVGWCKSLLGLCGCRAGKGTTRKPDGCERR